MGATPIFGFQTIEQAENYEFDALVNGVVTSIENRMPHKFVATLAALNGMSSPILYPNGTIAVLTGTDSGVNAGAMFTRAGDKWLLMSGTIANLSAFIAALTVNIGTLAGATFYDTGSSTSRIFTNGTGNSEILIGGSTWTPIATTGGWGTVGATLAYRLVPGGAILRGGIKRNDNKAIVLTQTLFTLPMVARPTAKTRFLASGTGNAVGTIEIADPVSGVAKLYATANRTSSYYFFDGMFLPQS